MAARHRSYVQYKSDMGTPFGFDEHESVRRWHDERWRWPVGDEDWSMADRRAVQKVLRDAGEPDMAERFFDEGASVGEMHYVSSLLTEEGNRLSDMLYGPNETKDVRADAEMFNELGLKMLAEHNHFEAERGKTHYDQIPDFGSRPGKDTDDDRRLWPIADQDWSATDQETVRKVLRDAGEAEMADRLFNEGASTGEMEHVSDLLLTEGYRMMDMYHSNPSDESRRIAERLDDLGMAMLAERNHFLEKEANTANDHIPDFGSQPVKDPKPLQTAGMDMGSSDRREVSGSLPDGVSMKQSGYDGRYGGKRGRRS